MERRVVENAAEAVRRRGRGDPIVVHDPERQRALETRRDLDRLHPAEVMQIVEDQLWDRRPPSRLRRGHVVPGSVLRVY